MYLIVILVLFPLPFLFNSYLAFAALAAAIVGTYLGRTRSTKRRQPRAPAGPEYPRGYEN